MVSFTAISPSRGAPLLPKRRAKRSRFADGLTCHVTTNPPDELPATDGYVWSFVVVALTMNSEATGAPELVKRRPSAAFPLPSPAFAIQTTTNPPAHGATEGLQ